jgi:membrane protease YdiL (CAAX protease family)
VAVLLFGASVWLSAALPAASVQASKALLVAPVIEEAFFRGIVQDSLRGRRDLLGRPWIAIVVTAACFGVAHIISGPPAHGALVMAPAVAIGWLYERRRSIPLCIVAHAACNAIWFSLRSL